MLICNRCGDTFDTPAYRKENHWEVDYGYEEIAVCPSCSSDNIDYATRCDICGDWICETSKERDKRVFSDWCYKCEDLALTVWQEAVEQIKECGFDHKKATSMLCEVAEKNW